jgi:CHAT domain-containing protein
MKNKFYILIWLFLLFTVFSETNLSKVRQKQAAYSVSAESVERLEREAKDSGSQWNYEAVEKAARLYAQTAEQWKLLEQFERASICLREAARLNSILNEKETALLLLNQSLEISRRNKNRDEQIKALSALSIMAFDEGSIKKSKSYFSEALRLAEKTNQPSARAEALFSAGEFYFYQKKLTEALGLFEQSLEQWQKAGDPEGEAKCLLEIGYALIEQNEFDQVFEKFERSLKKWRETNNRRGQALAYTALGLAYNMTDRKQEALKFYNRAVQIFPGKIDYFDKAVLFNGIGSIYEDYGQWDISLDYRKKAFEAYQKANHRFGQLATLPSLITLCFLIEDADAALQFSRAAETLSTELNAPYYLAKVQKNLGDHYLKTNAPQKSLIYFQQSLDFFKTNDFKREIALVSSGLGQIHASQNQNPVARKYFLNALELNRKVKDGFAEADTLFRLARLDFSENKKEAALESAQKAVEITELLYSDIFNSKLKSTYLSNAFDRYELYINVLMKTHGQNPEDNYAVLALQTAEKSRARSMLENLSLSEADFIKDADAETVGREKEIRFLLNAKADDLTDLLNQNAEKSETGKLGKEISELQSELEEIKAKLKENSPLYSAIKNPAPFDVGEFQKNVLDDDSLLLEFSFGKEESYLWLIGKNEFGSYVLPPRGQIESKIQILRELLASREKLKDESIEDYQTRVKKADEDYSKIAKELSRELFGQVAGKFGNKRLIIVPDGKLGYFPVSALPLPDSEKDEPILLSNEVVYEPSASTLSILAKNNKQINPASKSLLIFSDPVFSAEDSRLSPENKTDLNVQNETGEKFRFVESLNSLVRLDASKTEADSIIEILGNTNADNFSGFSANRDRLLETNAADYKILHFATHGLIDESRPELSGIILSRFDENGQQLDEFFRLHDIYGMNLKSDLVVLSACNTGIGKQVRGEGLMSLNNAFLSVGAKSVMSSLWKVEDGATLELMKNFYEAMANERLSPSKALQKAQIKMQKSNRYNSPFYWAAFTVQGDYKNVPDVSSGFGIRLYFLLFGIVFSLAAFFGYRFIRRQNRM